MEKEPKAGIDVERIRQDFPILGTTMNGKPLVYLDNAATSQKPKRVIDAISEYYTSYNANIHRGIYAIAVEATDAYVDSKAKLAKLINAKGMQEIVYTRNTTEAINLVALSWGNANIKRGDHILITQMEHHSNLVPWMLLARRKNAVLDYVRLDESNTKLDMQSLKEQLEKDPKIMAVTHVSNVLGTINDVKRMTKEAHAHGAVVLVDGAQSAPHMPIDVQDIGCDFFALSAHKMLGPTGIGALYGRYDMLDRMDPLFSGGDMIKSVTFDDVTWNDLPWKFEAGTPDIAGGIGFGAAIDYLNGIGMERIRAHEKKITKYALERLEEVKHLKTYGPGKDEMDSRGGVIAFAIDKVHPHDVSQIFDSEGIAIRAGHHCAMPLVTQLLGESAVSRMSFYLYNRMQEADKAVQAIELVKKTFGVG
jgi:cysteine desulfurase/selenocysteine lyase